MTSTDHWRNVDLVRVLEESDEVISLNKFTSSTVLERLSKTIGCHNHNKDSAWWWDIAEVDPFVISYGNNYAIYDRVWSIVGDIQVYLAVTHNFAPPWPMFFGFLSKFITLVGDANFTEYVIIDPAGKWAIFDNHHNALICFGYLATEVADGDGRIGVGDGDVRPGGAARGWR